MIDCLRDALSSQMFHSVLWLRNHAMIGAGFSCNILWTKMSTLEAPWRFHFRDVSQSILTVRAAFHIYLEKKLRSLEIYTEKYEISDMK